MRNNKEANPSEPVYLKTVWGAIALRSRRRSRNEGFFQSFYRKLSLVFILLLIAHGVAQVNITFNSSMQFVRQADQKLNLNLAYFVEKGREVKADFVDLGPVD